MKFTVERSSLSGYDQPCEGAMREKYQFLDQRTMPADRFTKDHWFGGGHGHGENETGAFRYFERDRWFIEINTLVDLMAFIAKHGQVVLDQDRIEIYDSYRE